MKIDLDLELFVPLIDAAVAAAIAADRASRPEPAKVEDPLLYSMAEAARLLDVSESELRKLRKEGRLAVIKVSTLVKVARQEIERIASEGVAEV